MSRDMQLEQLEIQHDERYMWLALFVVVIGTFMAILDSSIVNVAIPQMMTIFGATTDQIEWVLTGYMLTMGVVIPLTGYLGDTFGNKRMYIFALTVFTMGSALCGLVAWSTESMVAARVVQAIGGGMIMPIGMSMIFQTIPLERRGVALGVWGISALAAPAIGPTLSGYIVQYLDWRLIFTINIPVGILGVTFAALILRETPRVRNKRLDWAGALSSGLGLFTLLLALDKVASKGWSSPFIITLFFVCVLSFSALIFIELNHPEPLLDLRILKIFPFTLSVLISAITTIGLFGGVFLIPLYMENLRGYTAMQTGILMAPAAVATALMMPITGRIFDRHGAKWLTVAGISILTIASYLLSKISMDTAFTWLMWVLVIRGVGMGLSMMPIQTAGMNAVPLHLVGRASALSNTLRQVTASLGVAMLTTILQHRQAFHAENYAGILNLTSPSVVKAQAAMQGALAQQGAGPIVARTAPMLQVFREVMQQAMASGLDDTFLVATAICLVGIPLGFLIKKSHKPAKSSEGETMVAEF